MNTYPYSASASIITSASKEKVWAALTEAALVKKYFFGTDLVTTWEVGTPVLFRGEWEGKPYEDKGTVLSYDEGKSLSYDYFSSMNGDEDVPANYAVLTYTVEEVEGGVQATISQSNVQTQEKADHSQKNWNMILEAMKKMVEAE